MEIAVFHYTGLTLLNTQSKLLMPLKKKAVENSLGKGENAGK